MPESLDLRKLVSLRLAVVPASAVTAIPATFYQAVTSRAQRRCSKPLWSPDPNKEAPMINRQLSYAHGACDTPLIYQTIGVRFEQGVAQWPDHEAFVVCDQGVRLTFAEMKREVDRLAAGL